MLPLLTTPAARPRGSCSACGRPTEGGKPVCIDHLELLPSVRVLMSRWADAHRVNEHGHVVELDQGHPLPGDPSTRSPYRRRVVYLREHERPRPVASLAFAAQIEAAADAYAAPLPLPAPMPNEAEPPESTPATCCELCGGDPVGNWSLCARCNAQLVGEAKHGARPRVVVLAGGKAVAS